MKKIIFILAIGLLMLGCINFGQPQEKIGPAVDTSENVQPKEDKTSGVVITSTTNKTIVTEPSGISEPEKPQGIKYTEDQTAKLAVYFIYVGDEAQHGDAILIKKGDAEVLVDAGPKENAGLVIAALESLGVDDLEILVSTHADPEHYGGIPEVVKNYDVEQFFWSGESGGDANYSDIISSISKKKIPVDSVEYGSNFKLNGFELLVLNPPDAKNRFTDTDNNAVAIRVKQDKFCIMLNSDILYGAQVKLLQYSGLNLQCDIIQMPTHGLGIGNAQIDTLLLKVKPKTAILSGGQPDITSTSDKKGSRPATLEKLRIKGVTDVYENYKNGGKTVRVTTDGKIYTVEYVE